MKAFMINILEEKYNNLLLEAKHAKEKRKELMKKFIVFTCNEVGINKPWPKVSINNREDFGSHYKSFGYFDVGDNKIVVAGSNRNLGDMLRTLAHELVPYKQEQNGEINLDNAAETGADGSEIENEANAQAGVLLRKFGRDNPEIYE